MGVIYAAGFLTSAMQSRALFGTKGLNPAPGIIASASGHIHQHTRPVPAFQLLDPYLRGDLALEVISWFGLFLSLLLIVTSNSRHGVWAGLPFTLWGMYLSLVNLGGMIMNYGWEWETLEVGFLIIFLCPLTPSWPKMLNPVNSKVSYTNFPTPTPVLWLLMFGTFRLMIGAGMSKIGRNSSNCWMELSCTETHYETQPMPNALAWLFHKLPVNVHKVEVALTFFEQLILPWFAIFPPVFGYGVPRMLRQFCFTAECFFQLCIVGTGNYAWINYIGALPCFAMLDDDFLMNSTLTKWMFSQQDIDEASVAAYDEEVSNVNTGIESDYQGQDLSHFISKNLSKVCGLVGIFLRICVVIFILFKSVEPIKELFTPAPWLHFYDDYFFVNAHGVFGFINQHRVVLVLETSHSPAESFLQGAPEPCSDHRGAVARSSLGDPIQCYQLEDYCVQSEVAKLCPVTCGTCPQNIPHSITHAPPYSKRLDSATPTTTSIPWTGTLEFKNLPGDVYRAPSINSPYHYRFSWEVWIRTTASMERSIPFVALNRVRALGSADRARTEQLLPDLPIPPIIKAMIDKVLIGDSDAIGLMDTPRKELFRCVSHNDSDRKLTCHPPTAVRARYYLYNYSSWSDLTNNGSWWTREAISKPIIILSKAGSDGMLPESKKTPSQRHWILLTSVLGVVTSIRGIFLPAMRQSWLSLSTHGLFIVMYVGVFVFSMLLDYPEDFPLSFLTKYMSYDNSFSIILPICKIGTGISFAVLGVNFITSTTHKHLPSLVEIWGCSGFVMPFVILSFLSSSAVEEMAMST